MSDEIFLDGHRYISAAEAAAVSHLSRDYVARLCRDGKVTGKRIGKNWYISEPSLKYFLEQQEREKAQRREQLSRERSEAYREASNVRERAHVLPLRANTAEKLDEPGTREAANQPEPSLVPAPAYVASPLAPVTHTLAAHAAHVQEKMRANAAKHGQGAARYVPAVLSGPIGVQDAAVRTIAHGAMHVPVYTISPVVEFAQKFMALAIAFSMTFGTYALVDPDYARFTVQSTRDAARSIAQEYKAFTGGGMQSLVYRVKRSAFTTAEHPVDTASQLSASALAFIPETAESIARAESTH